MADLTLKKRVAALEARVAELESALETTRNPTKKWLRDIEKFAGDPHLQALSADALRLREADRKKARQRGKRRASA